MRNTVLLLLQTGSGSGSWAGVRPTDPDQSTTSYPDLLDATLLQLTTGLQDGDFTSVDLVNAYLARIGETSEALHAVTEINPEAVDIARRLDAARTAGQIMGPLHGIPVLLKDNIATRDMMNNTAGSYALLGSKAPEDSTVAAKLREAGAILLGKANLSQWAGARGVNNSQGWSAYGGQTIGAYYAEQDPAGSSSGSAVAASIGLAWAALGTETSGSIVFPASWNNVVGIKPTVGLTSRYLVVPISQHQDTVGPLARTVKDAAYLLQAIAGYDRKDNYTSAIPYRGGRVPDYVAACKSSALRGKRIGIPRAMFQDAAAENSTYAAVLAGFEKSLDILRSAGATVVDDVHLPGFEKFRQIYYQMARRLLLDDFASDLERRYLALLSYNPNNISTLEDARRFTRNSPREGFPDRDTVGMDDALAIDFNNTSPEFWELYTQLQHLATVDGISGALKNHSLDALVAPSNADPTPHALLGSPVVSVPMGAYPHDTTVLRRDFGERHVYVAPNIPFGLAFWGGRFSEETLIGMAYAFEQRTMVRLSVKPAVKPRSGLADIVTTGKRVYTEEELR